MNSTNHETKSSKVQSISEETIDELLNDLVDDSELETGKRIKQNLKTLISKKTLMKKKTNVITNLNCDVCECKFTRKDILKRHKINKH